MEMFKKIKKGCKKLSSEGVRFPLNVVTGV